jgi:uncharacterized protein
LVRDGLEALILRPIFYELAAMAVLRTADTQEWGVWSQGTFFPLAEASRCD